MCVNIYFKIHVLGFGDLSTFSLTLLLPYWTCLYKWPLYQLNMAFAQIHVTSNNISNYTSW